MRRFADSLDANNGHGILADSLKEIVQPPDRKTLGADKIPKRLIVSIYDLLDFDPELTAQLLVRPAELLPVFELAVRALTAGIRQELMMHKRKLAEYLERYFGSRRVSPRGLKANVVGSVVNVEGIVTRASVARRRLVLFVHYCPITRKFHEKTYRDNSSVISLAVFTKTSEMPCSSYLTKEKEENLHGISPWYSSTALVISGFMAWIQILGFRIIKGYWIGIGLISMSSVSFTFVRVALAMFGSLRDFGFCDPGAPCLDAYGRWFGTVMVCSLLEVSF
ncbi:DNA replication licensing factor Mcm3 [Gracilariopsis chorda]|uniref:DNA replication licensing factor Mcm3 n=1 Tax=Gracilariopsis chorda TaxID=448386 RepID=A0A2V3ISN7_9FLOR|nr:DNA replication licensing factor Mcm3 [Gracilariopsis chorda]|eukprot:PXF45109.1 DNA replication licensing factor Mcm3 [Gracilariopsis chorda]